MTSKFKFNWKPVARFPSVQNVSVPNLPISEKAQQVLGGLKDKAQQKYLDMLNGVYKGEDSELYHDNMDDSEIIKELENERKAIEPITKITVKDLSISKRSIEQALKPPHKPFGLLNMYTAARYYKALSQHGTTLKSGYLVTLKPFSNNATAKLPIFSELKSLLGFFATDVEIPVLAATFEQKRFGAFNFSRLAEYNYPSFTITFLETDEQHFLRSLLQYRAMMLSTDGTAKPPSEYALSLSVRAFGNGKNMKDGTVINKLVVAINLDSLQGLSAKDNTALEIPITFNVLSNRV